MALYYSAALAGDGQPLSVAVHSAAPLVAVGYSQNKAVIFNDDGERVAFLSRPTQPTVLLWHPRLKLLVVGWRDGQLSVWTEDGESTQPAAQHEGLAVLAMEWSSNANFLLTSSKRNVLVMWQIEDKRLDPWWSTECDQPVTSVMNLCFPKTRSDMEVAPEDDDLLFAVSGSSNAVSFLDDSQQLSPVITLERDVTVMATLWDKQRRFLIVMTNKNTISQYYVDFDMKVHMQVNRKISTGPGAELSLIQMIWVSRGLIATSAGEQAIRIFNLEQDTMYVLHLPHKGRGGILSLSACESKHLMAAGTKGGTIFLWSYVGPAQSTGAQDWQHIGKIEADSPITSLHFFSTGALAACASNNALVFHETLRRRKWSGVAGGVQVSPSTVIVESAQGISGQLHCNTQIKGLDVAFPTVALWTGRHVEIFAISESSGAASRLHIIEHASPVFGLHSEGVLLGHDDRLRYLNYQLHQMHQVSVVSTEGKPTLLNVFSDYLALVTDKNALKVYRITSRDLRPVGPTRVLFQKEETPLSIVSVKINANGKKAALLTQQANSAVRDSRLWVYDLDTDQISFHDFAETHEHPVSLCWNFPNKGGSSEMEYLLMACETRSSSDLQAEGDRQETQNTIWTLFAKPTSGVVPHHAAPLTSDQLCLVGCGVPDLWVCTSTPSQQGEVFKIARKRLRDFEGLQGQIDGKLKDVLMRFAYFTTTGNMDEAYRSVKMVKDASVWTNLAKMCVATKRLDVAEVCLANMQDAVAARSLREFENEPEVEARLAILALALEMPEQAEKLLRSCKRNDLLTELLIAQGKWEEAEKHAELYDRIRIRLVKYRFAQHMESLGNVDNALRLYEEAKCYGVEAPRMLFQLGRVNEIRSAVESSEDKELILWWAQYLESLGEVQEAYTYYTKGGDIFNAVRILCSLNPPKINEALELLPRADNAGAGYFIGRYYEQQGPDMVTKALQFFDKAGAYRHAIRLAKENDLFNEVLSLSVNCGDPSVLLDSAYFFEERGVYDKAVQLYQKGGDTPRAIDVCIKGGLFDALHQISETLDSAASPETFLSMAEVFITSQHYEKAAQMLVFAKAYNEALQLCMDKNVTLTESMAEAMTIPKTESEEDEAYRMSLLKKIAKVAKQQGSWAIACKKYTQAGERVKAMKMLLRSGDTEKIIFFAKHARNPEIYVLAANFLQTQSWHQDQNLLNTIVTFYKQGKAIESLAGFYDSYAQLQIDEYRDYDKALTTMREAQKCLVESGAAPSKLSLMQQRLQFMENLVSARRMIKPGEPCPQMVQICNDLLDKSQRNHPMRDVLESAVRPGDIYALLVEYYDVLGDPRGAFAQVEKMLAAEIELSYFLDGNLIKKVCAAVGKDPNSLQVAKASPPRDASGLEFVEEEVDDE